MTKGEVSDTIIVIGVLVLISITVLTAFLALDRVELPKEPRQEVSGSNTSAAAELSKLVDSCWRKAGQGQSSEKIDCFNVKVYSNGSIHESMIERNLEVLSDERFSLDSSNVPDGESSLKVSYRPVSDSVNITVISVCDPGAGDTCYSVSCSCETACGPGFDPDGDGTSETNQKGCITDYKFNPSTDPCSVLSCSDSTIYENLNVVGSEITFDSEENISLRNVEVKALSTTSTIQEFELRAENQLSPSEVVGTGSNERTLFKGEASLNISSLSPDNYGMFIWSCEVENLPSNCKWKAYNFTVT